MIPHKTQTAVLLVKVFIWRMPTPSTPGGLCSFFYALQREKKLESHVIASPVKRISTLNLCGFPTFEKAGTPCKFALKLFIQLILLWETMNIFLAPASLLF